MEDLLFVGRTRSTSTRPEEVPRVLNETVTSRRLNEPLGSGHQYLGRMKGYRNAGPGRDPLGWASRGGRARCRPVIGDNMRPRIPHRGERHVSQ